MGTTPKHVAITVDGLSRWAKRESRTMEETISASLERLNQILKAQVDMGLPILTLNMSPSASYGDSGFQALFERKLSSLLESRPFMDYLVENQVKVTVLGKWYSLSQSLVDDLKKVIATTREYDRHFLNLCLNYDGQEEILDGVRLLARMVESGKISPDDISGQTLKENLYSSFFIPPGLVIVTGGEPRTKGFLLWDSASSEIIFTDMDFPDLSKAALMDIMGGRG